MTELINKHIARSFPLIKLFEVEDSIYLYDAKSNFLTEVTKDDIEKYLTNPQSDNQIFLSGAFKKVVPDECDLNDLVDYQLDSYFPRKFTLEVTEECNLKCKYCFFARETKNVTRKHSFRKIDIKTAKKAIDFYFDFYISQLMKVPENKRDKLIAICPPRLSWWGGEPFLAFDVIKETQKYFESLEWEKFGVKQQKLTYITVSNLTVMNEEIAEFLVENNVLLHVSLDGGKEENDRNRVSAGEKGTFDVIMKNLMYLIEKYPDYSKRKIIIQSVAADNIDIKKSYDFMEKHFKINTEERVILQYIVYGQKKQGQLFSQTEKQIRNEISETDTFKKLLNILSKKHKTDIMQYLQNNKDKGKEFADLLLLEKKLRFDNPQSVEYQNNIFSCPVGADVLFVAVDGNFHMCMKSDYSLPLGNVNTTLNKNVIVDLYKNHISGLRKKCKDCWATGFCQICPAQTLNEKHFLTPTESDCRIIRNKAAINVRKYILFTKDVELYNTIKEIYGNPESDDFALDLGPININILKF